MVQLSRKLTPIIPSDRQWSSLENDKSWQLLGSGLIALIMICTIFEGAPRKWLFTSVPLLRYACYFSKDALFLLAAFIGARNNRDQNVSWFVLPSVLMLLPSLASTLSHSNLVGAALSLRAYLVIPVCAYYASGLVRGFRDVERCAIIVAWSAIFVAGLGAYQYQLPQTHFLNRYDAGDDAHIVFTAGHVRAVGTFTYIGGMAIMSGFSAWAGIFLSLPSPTRTIFCRLLGIAALVSGAICAAVSMSRSGLMFWTVTAVGGFFLYYGMQDSLVRVFAVAAILWALFATNSVGEMDNMSGSKDSIVSGIAHRMENADSFGDRLSYVINNLIYGLTNHVLGEGLGLGQPGGQYAATGEMKNPGYESEWGRIAFEIGPLGLLGVLIIRFASLRRLWKEQVRCKDPQKRLILSTALPFFGIMSLGWMAFNHVGNSAAWAIFALALGMAENVPSNRRSEAP